MDSPHSASDCEMGEALLKGPHEQQHVDGTYKMDWSHIKLCLVVYQACSLVLMMKLAYDYALVRRGVDEETDDVFLGIMLVVKAALVGICMASTRLYNL